MKSCFNMAIYLHNPHQKHHMPSWVSHRIPFVSSKFHRSFGLVYVMNDMGCLLWVRVWLTMTYHLFSILLLYNLGFHYHLAPVKFREKTSFSLAQCYLMSSWIQFYYPVLLIRQSFPLPQGWIMPENKAVTLQRTFHQLHLSQQGLWNMG